MWNLGISFWAISYPSQALPGSLIIILSLVLPAITTLLLSAVCLFLLFFIRPYVSLFSAAFLKPALPHHQTWEGKRQKKAKNMFQKRKTCTPCTSLSDWQKKNTPVLSKNKNEVMGQRAEVWRWIKRCDLSHLMAWDIRHPFFIAVFLAPCVFYFRASIHGEAEEWLNQCFIIINVTQSIILKIISCSSYG